MAKHRFVRYLHSSKESNYDIEEHFGNPKLLYVGYEEKIIYEYDDETDECELIGVNDRFLGTEIIPPESIVAIPED